MGLQVFPELFYNQILNGERIGISDDNQRLTIQPPESFASQVKRFFTFQQDPYIDRVHDRIKNILEQFEQAEGQDFSTLKTEIRAHRYAKYEYLEANLAYLRRKLDKVGQLNCVSSLILRIRNAIANFFGIEPIEIKKYANFYYCGSGSLFHFYPQYRVEGSFEFRTSFRPVCDSSAHPGLRRNPLNPIERETFKLTREDTDTCRFADDFLHSHALINLEKGLETYYLIKRGRLPSVPFLASLEISFDPEQQRYFAAINNSYQRPFYSLQHKKIMTKEIPSDFATRLQEMSLEEKTFRFFIRTTDRHGNATDQEIAWTLELSSEGSLILNQGSQPFYLEPGFHYQFCDQQRQPIPHSDLKIIDFTTEPRRPFYLPTEVPF